MTTPHLVHGGTLKTCLRRLGLLHGLPSVCKLLAVLSLLFDFSAALSASLPASPLSSSAISAPTCPLPSGRFSLFGSCILIPTRCVCPRSLSVQISDYRSLGVFPFSGFVSSFLFSTSASTSSSLPGSPSSALSCVSYVRAPDGREVISHVSTGSSSLSAAALTLAAPSGSSTEEVRQPWLLPRPYRSRNCEVCQGLIHLASRLVFANVKHQRTQRGNVDVAIEELLVPQHICTFGFWKPFADKSEDYEVYDLTATCQVLLEEAGEEIEAAVAVSYLSPVDATWKICHGRGYCPHLWGIEDYPEMRRNKAERNLQISNQFLLWNKQHGGVHVTPEGLQYLKLDRPCQTSPQNAAPHSSCSTNPPASSADSSSSSPSSSLCFAPSSSSPLPVCSHPSSYSASLSGKAELDGSLSSSSPSSPSSSSSSFFSSCGGVLSSFPSCCSFCAHPSRLHPIVTDAVRVFFVATFPDGHVFERRDPERSAALEIPLFKVEAAPPRLTG
eukprot:GHVT01075054.1.p1 GENE.GHVT01075054.1~~GHVT01075054.1.p1  ORF type:complete len:500 (-),score=92.56 GHVT01075054.1:1968-3467(-)